MKSSIIKAVRHTQFETCVTAFIALDFKLRREKLSGWDLRSFPSSKAVCLFVTEATHSVSRRAPNEEAMPIPYKYISHAKMEKNKVTFE